jgi:hypothetical protein
MFSRTKNLLSILLASVLMLSIWLPYSATATPLSQGSSKPGDLAFELNFQQSGSQYIFTDTFSRHWLSNRPSELTDVLPACIKETDYDCIQSVEGKSVDGDVWEEFTPETVLHNLHVNRDLSKPYAYFTPPDANFPMLWKAPESMRTEAGLSYLISAYRWAPGLTFRISPVEATLNVRSRIDNSCITHYQEIDCIRAFNFPKNVEVRMKIRLNYYLKDLSGWMQGSAFNPKINVQKSSNFVLLTLQGEPIYRPSAWIKVPTEDQIKLNPNAPCKPDSDCTWIRHNNYLYDFKLFSNRLEEKSLGEASAWAFYSWQNTYLRPVNPCEQNIESGMSGYIFNNAAIYDSNRPSWDPQSSSLNYEVASPHFLSDGSVASGYYQLVISQKTAECLWKVNAMNSKAAVQIIDSNGANQVATTTVRVSDGFVYISVSGFHYSASKISLALKSTATASSPKPSSKVVSYRCRKGKTVKSFKAAKPICPKGYVLVK